MNLSDLFGLFVYYLAQRYELRTRLQNFLDIFMPERIKEFVRP